MKESTTHQIIPRQIRSIERIVGKTMGVPRYVIRGFGREQEACNARRVVWLIAHRHLGYNLSYIGRIYSRHHTTIMTGVNRIDGIKEIQKKIDCMVKKHPTQFRRIFPD